MKNYLARVIAGASIGVASLFSSSCYMPYSSLEMKLMREIEKQKYFRMYKLAEREARELGYEYGSMSRREKVELFKHLNSEHKKELRKAMLEDVF